MSGIRKRIPTEMGRAIALRERLGASIRVAVVGLVCALPCLGSDRALVPLELPGEAPSTRIRKALRAVEDHRYREGAQELQAVLQETRGSGIVARVPAELPRQSAALLAALEEIAKAPQPEDEVRTAQTRRFNLVVDRQGRLVAQTLDVDESPDPGRRYIPVDSLAEAAILALPAEGLEAYRQLHDPLASRLLDEFAKDGRSDALRKLALDYFATSAGADGAEILGDTLFEGGDYRGAVDWWRKTVVEHSVADVPRARMAVKVLLALRLLGEEREYAFERVRLAASAAGSASLIADLERRVPLTSREDLPPLPTSSRWGGEITPARPPDLPAIPLHLSWDSWLWSRDGLAPYPGPSRFPATAIPRDRRFVLEPSPYFPFVPLVDGRHVYVSGVFALFRLDARPRGGSIQRVYQKPLAQELAGYKEESDSALSTVALWRRDIDGGPRDLPPEILVTHYVEDQVRARQYKGFAVTVKIPIRGLVAFDAGSGSILWKTVGPAGKPFEEETVGGSGALEEDEEDFPWEHGARRPFGELGVSETAALKDFSYTSPVIVKRGLVVAGGWAQRGYVTSSVRALDLRTGSLVWETPVVNSGLVERTMFGELAQEPFWGAIAEEGGVIYYLSQMGAVAALELATGHVRWLSTYDTIVVPPSPGRFPLERDSSWGPNPILLLGTVLIVAPRDSAYLYAFDAGRGPDGAVGAGRVLWTFPNAPGRDGMGAGLRDVVGYHHARLWLGGLNEISYLDLGGMDGRGRIFREGKPLSTPEKVQLSPTTLIRVVAPGCLTTSGVVYAGWDGLHLMNSERGRDQTITQVPFRESEVGGYAGRVSVAPGSVILTSRHIISTYVPAPAAPAAPPAARRPTSTVGGDFPGGAR